MATELAKAYVQIIPSAKGIKGSISNVLGTESSDAGNKAGLSIGKGLVSKLKVAVAAAGIGKLIGESLKEGAKLQQNIGGIETLFGAGGAKNVQEYAKIVGKSVGEVSEEFYQLKKSETDMLKYANKAYKDAGLSANEYMETVTGFAASLKQSAGGDMESLTKAANQAVIDMADNANKMGTPMESIQNAYQGFAKQNYTMLDNLKLGYGGTKKEMQRLLQDAQKITGVKYDINNLNDVYSAIHVIQGELGITGTTAKEAEKTLSGSFNSMKSAAKNVLADLAVGNDVRESLGALLHSTYIFLKNNLLPMLCNILKSTFNAVLDIVRTTDWISVGKIVIEEIKNGIIAGKELLSGLDFGFVENIANYITEKLPDLLQKGNDIIKTIFDGMMQQAPGAILYLGEIFTNMVNFIYSNIPTLLEAGATLIKNLLSGFVESLPDIDIAIGKVIMNIISTIGKNLPSILQTGIKIIAELIAGIIQAIPKLIVAIPKIISAIKDEFGKVDWKTIGINILEGIAKGLRDGLKIIIDAAREAAKAALDSAKEYLGIKSPSRVMRDEVGRWIPEGIAVGVRKNLTPIKNAMQVAVEEMTGRFDKDIYAGVSMSYKNDYKTSGITGTNGTDGFIQNITINSPKQLSPYEVARQTRNATRNMVLALKGV